MSRYKLTVTVAETDSWKPDETVPSNFWVQNSSLFVGDEEDVFL